MSAQYYYQDGVLASATMKADYSRVKAARPSKFASRPGKEMRAGTTVDVVVPADAVAMTPRQRHDFWTKRVR